MKDAIFSQVNAHCAFFSQVNVHCFDSVIFVTSLLVVTSHAIFAWRAMNYVVWQLTVIESGLSVKIHRKY